MLSSFTSLAVSLNTNNHIFATFRRFQTITSGIVLCMNFYWRRQIFFIVDVQTMSLYDWNIMWLPILDKAGCNVIVRLEYVITNFGKDLLICHCTFGLIDWFLVFDATFSNISVISWRPVLVMEEAVLVMGLCELLGNPTT